MYLKEFDGTKSITSKRTLKSKHLEPWKIKSKKKKQKANSKNL